MPVLGELTSSGESVAYYKGMTDLSQQEEQLLPSK